MNGQERISSATFWDYFASEAFSLANTRSVLGCVYVKWLSDLLGSLSQVYTAM